MLWSVTGLLLLVGIFYFLLQSPYVQTYLVKYVIQRVEKTTGVKISVGGVDFRPMRSLLLNDVLLRDFRNDTLLYCADLRIKADSFNLVNRSFNISEVVLHKAIFNLWVEDSTNETNIERFISALSPASEGEPAESPELEQQPGWLIALKKITLKDSRFTYREEIFKPIDYGVNWTDIDCRHLNVQVTGMDFTGSPMRMEVSGLSFVEKSGLCMKTMSGKVKAGASNLLVTDCHFELAQSSIDLNKLEFNWTPGQHDWKYFTSRMHQYYELGPSAVSFTDLAYFNGMLRGITNTVRCSGVVSNTIEQLEGHDLYFELGDKSVFQGSFKSVGLPDVRNTVFDIRLHKAHLGPEDLASVYLPWFDMNIPVPAPLRRLAYIDFEQISFNGTFSEFIVKAQSITPALQGRLSFIYGACPEPSPDCSAMSGDFNFNRIDFGKLAGTSVLGTGVVTGSYAGIWDSAGPSFHVNTRLHRLGVHKGSVRGVDIAMAYGQDKLDLMASVDNAQVKGGMVMSYDLNDSLDFVSLRGNVEMGDPGALGFALAGGEEKIGATVDLVHAGQKDKSFTNLTLSDVYYAGETGRFDIENLSVEDSRYKDRNTTTLNSDVLDISIDGNYREVRPLPFVLGLVQNYLPAYAGKNTSAKIRKSPQLQDFDYTIQLKDANRVLKVLYPDLRISAGTKVASYYNSDQEVLNLNFQADTISYKDIRLLGSDIRLAGNPERLRMKYLADRIVYGSGYQLYNVRDELVLADNHLDNRISWCNWEDKTYSGDISACVIFTPHDKQDYTTEIKIHPGVIVMDDSVWHVNKSSIFIEGKEIRVSDFGIRRGKEFLSVNGQISETPGEKLLVNLENFNLSNFTRILLKRQPEFFGMATGAFTVQDFYKDFLLISDFEISNWGINRDTLGSLHLQSYWDAENRSVIIGAENRVGNKIPLLVSGYYTPATDTLNVNVNLKKVGLERLGIYASDYFSDTRGYLSGNVTVAGALRKPDISGFVFLDSVGMKINMLNTNFYVHDSIRIVKSSLLFHDFRLQDVNGSEAVLDGEYRFWEGRYRLKSRFNEFQVLNTGFADNESFYGQMYLSGMAELDNQDGVTNVTINARTENESRLYLPLSAGVNDQNNNFLHFINTGQPDIPREQLSYSNTDINLNANLELNEHLNVQVIFDPTVGDVLRTTGKGNIKFAFDKEGSLSLFGDYVISRGDYLFTLSNLVNKKFVLTPGGTISWSGSPYDAMLNVSAVYSLKTTISELLPVTESTSVDESGTEDKSGSTESSRKVPVECILNLSENLANPVVKFDINFPSLETQSKSYIQSLFSSQDEINKQMFSLLVLNRFYRTDDNGGYGNQAQTAGVTTLTEMFTNQLSRLVSQFSENVDIGFAYRFGDRDKEMTSDEIELAFSTQLLNDRVTISANGNMDVGGNKNATGADNQKTNIAGDFDVEVKLNRQGTLKMKAYSHTDEKLLYNNTETIQGVGVSYQESFDTLRELLKKYFGFLRRKR